MEFKIHYTINGTDDYFLLSGETLADITILAKKEMNKRGLEGEKNNLWSEKVT